jgi:C4-dicarboxylate-specific signal transduction histidine kinase
MKYISLKTKIVGSVVFSYLLLSILISLTLFFFLDKRLVDSKLEEVSLLNIEQTHESIQIFKESQTFTKMLGTRTRVKEYLLNPTEERRIELLSIFEDYAKDDDKILSLYLLDEKGIAKISTDKTFVGQDYSFRDYYKEGIKGRDYVDILLGKTSNQFGYYFSYPVLDNDKKVLGVFVTKINDKDIDFSIVNSALAKNSTIMLVDQYGIVISSNDKEERFLKSLGKLNTDEIEKINQSNKFLGKEILPLQYDLVQDVLRAGTSPQTFSFYDVEDGETEIININKVGNFPFYIVSETGLEQIDEIIFLTTTALVGLILILIFLVSFVIYKILLKSFKPLIELELLADNISKGDFSKRIDIELKDEFGNLANSFNIMTDKLKEEKENTEKKIKDRTKELEKLNSFMTDRELKMIELKGELLKYKNK